MGMERMAEQFARLVDEVETSGDLSLAMLEISHSLGFQFFALTHHVQVVETGQTAIRLHNYPERWADYYDRHGLGVSDPVHRASHVTSVGFAWSRIPEMIPLTIEDERVLALGCEWGIGDGFTVPAHVPGEARGSCSFANNADRPVATAFLPMAQLAGAFAFEGARRLRSNRGRLPRPPPPRLTDRQRDCLLWAARGKTDWEIGRIIGVTEETVARHIKLGCARYGVSKRTLLAIRALFDGTLTFDDIFPR